MNNFSKLFLMCFNWQVLAVLVVVGGGLFLFLLPGKALAVAPLLLVALCPLSIIFMMSKMKDKGKDETQ